MRTIYTLIHKNILIVGLISIVMGCNDFLEEPEPTTAVSQDQVFASENGVRAYFNGIYRNLRRQWKSVDEKSGGNTETRGVVSLNITREVNGIDMILPSGWYDYDYQHDNRGAFYTRTKFVWDFLYETGNQANIIVKGVAESELSESAKKKFTAEARAIRAWVYFNLIREYQYNYAVDPTAPGVPIYTEPASIESEGHPRATVQDVYDLILGDLEYAVQNLDPSGERVLKSNINIHVAQGLLARVNLEIGQWEAAKNAAIAARDGYDLDAENYNDGFNQIENNEWIWGFPQSNDQTLYYSTPAAFFNHLVPAYNSVYINDDFVNLFSETDVRKLFTAGFYGGNPTSYYYYITTKFMMNEDFSDDFVMMRSAEMYLIEAEAKAELDEADAGDILFMLQSNRDPNAVKSGNTGQDLIDEILIERRKELYGEIGIGYLDLKRRQLPLVRTGNHPEAYRFNFPANSKVFTLRIPQLEIDSNESIGESDQNP